MADRLGVVFVELDLDKTKFEKGQQQIIQQANSTALSIEKNYQILGVKSDNIFNAMAQGARNAYERIAASSKTSADEQYRAQAAMVAKINSLNQEMTKNPLYETLGIRSVAAIEAQQQAVIRSFNTISQHVQKGSQDWINIERAKNEKLKELHKEMVGSHEMSMASMTRAVLKVYAAYYVLSSAAQVLVQPFVKGFKAVEDYAQSVASLAAMVVTFSEARPGQTLSDQWQSALKYSTAIIPVLEQIAAKTLLSGQETTALANAFARSGVFLQANNTAQIEGFTRISNALPLMTKGQEIMRQINTEIRSVMTGQNEQSSMMLQTLKALPGYSKENLELWRQQGTVLENIGKLLEGFGPATAMLENQWQAVKTTLDTTVTQILRAGMLGTYGEIITNTKELNQYLLQNKESFIEGISVWLGNFMLGLFSVKAEVLRLAMLLDKLGGSMTSAKMLLYGPGAALGVESSKKRFEEAADQNIMFENRYKENDAELVKLAERYNKLEQSISAAGLAAAKLARSMAGGDEKFKAKPHVDEAAAKKAAEELAKAIERNLEQLTHSWAKYYDDKDKQAKADAKAMEDYEKERSREAQKYDEQQAKNYLSFVTWREKMIQETIKGTAEIAKEEAKAKEDAAETYRRIMISEESFDTDRKEQAMKRIIDREKEKYKIIDDLRKADLISALQAEEAKKKITESTAAETRKLTSETFFKENSDREQAFSSMASNFEKMGQLYAADSRERQVLSNLSKAATIAEIALQVEKNLMIAIGAVVNQGTGDPYSAFARIAAMVAVVAGVLSIGGIAFGGGGGGVSAPSAAYGQNTTVLGGANDQGSESIQKSWELLRDTYDMENTKLTGIYNEMKDLNQNIIGLVTNIIRGGGSFTQGVTSIDLGQTSSRLSSIAAKYSLYADKIFAGIDQWLWGSTTTSQVGSGIGVDAGSIREITGNQGASVSPYKWGNWVTNKKGGLFGSDSSTLTGENTALDAASARMMQQVYTSLSNSIILYGQELGADMDKVFAYSFGNLAVNLMGKTSEEISKAISEAISTMSDTAANALLGDVIGQYQKLNEGLMETASRLLIDKAVIADVLDMTGQTYSGTIPQMIAFSEALIDIAGGLDKLQEAASTYYDKFYTDAEKQADLQKMLAENLGTVPGSRTDYRAAVEALNLQNEADQKRYVLMMQLAGAADEYYSVLEDALPKVKTATDLLEDYNNATKDLIQAYDNMISAQESLVGSLQNSAKAIKKWIIDISLGNLAPAKSAESYEFEYARQKALATAPGAKAEDISAFLSYASTYLEFQKGFGTAGSYQTIYDSVLRDMLALQGTVEDQLDIEELRLTVLQEAASALKIAAGAMLTSTGSIASAFEVATKAWLAAATALGGPTAASMTGLIVDALYMSIMKRASDPEGKAYYVNLINTGQKTIADISADLTWAYAHGARASGGYADRPTIFGEAGGEWAVPTYEPQRKNFLKSAPKAFWDNLGLNGGSNGPGGEITVTANFILDGKVVQTVVAKGMKSNPELIESTRRAVN